MILPIPAPCSPQTRFLAFRRCSEQAKTRSGAHCLPPCILIAHYSPLPHLLLQLRFFDPAQKKWGQAHIRASYALLSVLLEAGEGFVRIETTELDGKPSILIHLDKSKITTVGKQAVGSFLRVSPFRLFWLPC